MKYKNKGGILTRKERKALKRSINVLKREGNHTTLLSCFSFNITAVHFLPV